MKKIILGMLIGTLVLTGCDFAGQYDGKSAEQWAQTYTQESQQRSEGNSLINTYRNPKLLFQISYPKNWQINNYVDTRDNNIISSFYIESMPEPVGGYNISNMPMDMNWISVVVEPHGTFSHNDPDAFGIGNAKLVEKDEIDVGGRNSKLIIVAYDANDYASDDEEYPHIYAYYYGNNYTYEFAILANNRGQPFNKQDPQIQLFKKILSSFKEIE